jgi:hypothetical protein
MILPAEQIKMIENMKMPANFPDAFTGVSLAALASSGGADRRMAIHVVWRGS